jgi:hypothetical protein
MCASGGNVEVSAAIRVGQFTAHLESQAVFAKAEAERFKACEAFYTKALSGMESPATCENPAERGAPGDSWCEQP